MSGMQNVHPSNRVVYHGGQFHIPMTHSLNSSSSSGGGFGIGFTGKPNKRGGGGWLRPPIPTKTDGGMQNTPQPYGDYQLEPLPRYNLPRPGRSLVPLIKLPLVKKAGRMIPGPWRQALNILDILNTIGGAAGGWAKTPDTPGYYDLASYGFSPCWDPCGIGDWEAVSVSGGGCSPTFHCLTFQVPAFTYGDAIVMPWSGTGRNAIHFGPWHSNGIDPHARMDYDITYMRPTYNPATGQTWPQVTIPFIQPVPGPVFPVAPTLDPVTRTGTMTAVGHADPAPSPLDPHLNPDAAPSPAGSGSGGQTGSPSPVAPASHWDPRNPRPTPGTHIHVPASPDKKIILHYGALGNIYGGITEAGDLIDSLSKAIPGNPCGKHKRIHEKAMCVWRNRGNINLPQAAKNILLNQLQDTVIGTIGGIGKKAVRNAANRGYYRGAVGFQGGDRFHAGQRMVNL